jgi:hypothetical protein
VSSACGKEVTACLTSGSVESICQQGALEGVQQNRNNRARDRGGPTITILVGNLGPSDLEKFGPLTKHLTSIGFTSDADVKQSVISCVQALDVDFLYVEINSLMSLWGICLSSYGSSS